MTNQPPEILKSFANRLAELACSENGRQLGRMLRLMGLLGTPTEAPQGDAFQEGGDHAGKIAPASDAQATDRIGIWERKQENGQTYFVRSKEMLQDWNYWANIGKIEPKGKKLRVLLLGESVARGYLYDPQFTPALALEKMLASQYGPGEIEVIDLARTNLGLDVQELALASLQLEPDAVIIFSGNNWRGAFPPPLVDLPRIDALLQTEGMTGLMRLATDHLGELVRATVKAIGSVYASKGVPLLWIIPEFNLGDWRDPLINAPHLFDDNSGRWIAYIEEAREALRAGDLAQAAHLAQTASELDKKTSVAPMYILAECCEKSGDTEGARQYLEAARDSVIWDSSKSASPRTYSVTQKVLREDAEKYGGQVVDMPALFKEYLEGGIPGRRLFLDYCHLTSEGIQVVMAAAASSLLRSLKKAEISWQDLRKRADGPSREVESEAAFLAAVHNAHWWQSSDLVEYYCAQAVEFSPKIAGAMDHFIDLQTRRTPMLMCRSAEQISALGSPLIQHYLLRYNNQQLDQVLLGAVVKALKKTGVDAQVHLDRLRREEHSVTGNEINLLEYYYCSAGLQPQEVVWVLPKRDRFVRKENHYYRAYWRESRFVFVGEANSPVRLQITCRLPAKTEVEGSVRFTLNGGDLGEIAAGQRWKTWDISVAGGQVRDGLNEISVQWPLRQFPGREGYEGVMDDLLEGNIPEFFFVFGEIHAFTASGGRKAKEMAPAMQPEYSVIGAP